MKSTLRAMMAVPVVFIVSLCLAGTFVLFYVGERVRIR